MILDSVKDVDGLGVMDSEVYESEKSGGGRLIRSGLNVARLKDEAVDLNTYHETLKLLCLRQVLHTGCQRP